MKYSNWSIWASIISIIGGIALTILGWFPNIIPNHMWLIISFMLSIIYLLLEQLLTSNNNEKKNEILHGQIQSINDEMNSMNNSIGFFKKIKDASIWNFEGQIHGWNPNWAIELNNSKLKKELLKTHYMRINNPEVKKITYYFLEKYDIFNENGNKIENTFFGSTHFLSFLKSIDNFEKSTFKHKLRKNIYDKYAIYIIPAAKWKKNKDDDKEKNLHKYIKRFRDNIFIAGVQNNLATAIIFFNHIWYYNSEHTHHLEMMPREASETIPGNKVLGFFNGLPERMKNNSINEQKVKYNKIKKRYELV